MSAPEQQPQAAAAGATTTAESGDIAKYLKATNADRQVAENWLRTLVGEVTKGTVKFDKNVTKSIKAGMAAIDAAMSKQVAAILHNPDFQKLEGTWRGLNYLVMNSNTSTMLKIKVLNITKKELFRDVNNATEFDQSQIFKKIYEDEFGTPGGQPYGSLIGDYEFTNHPDDITLLRKMSEVAAAAFCPFVSAASPDLLGFKSWTELSGPRDLKLIFDTPEYTSWRSYRESEDSRFVTLVMPRVLARLPYGARTKPIEEFEFEEVESDSKGKHKPVAHEHYTWMNASYIMAQRLTNAFDLYGWCTAIRGHDNRGGKVENLPAHVFATDEGDLDLKCPTEIAITDRREKELSDCGYLPLCHYKGTDYAVFFGGQTTQKPQKYDRPEATANAAISARLPYIMATSRIAHYLKVMGRNWIGTFKEAEDVENKLNRWINNYVNASPTATEDMRAKFPLREAKIKVEKIPGKPGSYQAQAFLRPWLQFEELTAALSMVAEIPQMKS